MAVDGRHDDRLLDALEGIGPTRYDGPMWRVVQAGRSPLDGSRGAGRWNPAKLSVLYGAEQADGALAEIYFHLSQQQPIFPSKMRHNLLEMHATLGEALSFADLEELAKLQVDPARYRETLYSRTQEIAAAAAYLGFHGIIAPSARWNCLNVILFLDKVGDLDDAVEELQSSEVDWKAWRERVRTES